MDFIQLFNAIVKEVKTSFDKYKAPSSMESSLSEAETGLDSLDVVMSVTILGEVYGVPEAVVDKSGKMETLNDLKDFLEREGTRIPQSLEEALESIA